MADRAPPPTAPMTPSAPMTPIAPFRNMAPIPQAAHNPAHGNAHGNAPGSAPGNAPGVIATDRDGLGLATVAVRSAMLPALAARVRERFGVELPQGNTRREANGVAFAGVGPGAWLASRESGPDDWAALLMRELAAFASISDQSDGYAVLRLTGPRLRDALAKLVPVDLHPRAFKVGDVASTLAFHMGVTLWRPDDAADGATVFEIAVFRSFAGSFWHALSHSAAEFGLVMGAGTSRRPTRIPVAM